MIARSKLTALFLSTRCARVTAGASLVAAMMCVACGHKGVTEAGQANAAERDSVQIDKSSPRMQFLKVEAVTESDSAGVVSLTGRVSFDEDHTQRVSSPLTGRATALLVK